MSNFLTLEDVNSTLFNNQGFWYHKMDLSKIPVGDEDYSGVTVDFCKVSREKLSNGKYKFTVIVDNDLWTYAFYLRDSNGVSIPTGYVIYSRTNYTFTFTVLESDVILYLYMGIQKVPDGWEYVLDYIVGGDELQVTYDMLNKPYSVQIKTLRDTSPMTITISSLSPGYHMISRTGGVLSGVLYVVLVKTDFQFICEQSLTVGKVNTVSLGALDGYKLNGDMIGTNTPTITVQYGKRTLPVTWNSSLNDYTFELDLTDETEEKKIKFKVNVEANDALNSSETDVVLESKFETINTFGKLRELCRIGGTGRLSSNINITSDLTLTHDVLIVGNGKILNLNTHKIMVPSNRTFKAENTLFTNGVNSIQQYPNSSVEITDCTFTGCTGMGSCIDCQVDVESLDDETDFNTTITNCTFTDNDMCILHGGDLTVTDCTVNGKIGDKNYPYFLYQTDGNATLLQNSFSLIGDERIDTDIEFNSCIFICGETANINNYSYNELQSNNLMNFLSLQRNSSTIDVIYYYPSIEDYVTLSSTNGYCHSVSGVDFAFKTNITLTRGE
jgi:hypothetical protein